MKTIDIIIAIALVINIIFITAFSVNSNGKFKKLSAEIDTISAKADDIAGEIETISREISPDHLYSIPATVTDVSRDEGGLVAIEDLRGERWVFQSGLAWEIGDEITVIFNSQGTGDLTDDEIIAVNWNGEYAG